MANPDESLAQVHIQGRADQSMTPPPPTCKSASAGVRVGEVMSVGVRMAGWSVQGLQRVRVNSLTPNPFSGSAVGFFLTPEPVDWLTLEPSTDPDPV